MRRIAVLLLSPVLVAGLLAGCGGSGGSAGSTPADQGLPSVTGSYGDKPKITLAKGEKPSRKLRSAVLTRGDGPKVAKGDLLVADYLGSVYKSGRVFDNSYDRKAPAAFTVGVGKVVSGWDKTLVGVPVGSRVLMVLPPKEGYGAKGNPQVGIKGTDSLVFVVDLIARYGPGSTPPAPTAAKGLPKGLPKVSGAWGQEPTVTIPKGTTPPKRPTETVLGTGSGEKVAKGRLVVLQYAVTSWEGKPLSKTWGQGPLGVAVGAAGGKPGANPFDLLLGTSVGSRVLLTFPAQSGGVPAKDSIAVVVDVIGQNATAKQEGGS